MSVANISQVNDIFGVDYFDNGDDAYFRSAGDVGFPPPSYNNDLGASCDCKQVLVSSLGEAQHIQPGAKRNETHIKIYSVANK